MPIKWLEVSVRADLEAAEAISELFNGYGQGGAVIEQWPLTTDEGMAQSGGFVLVKAYLDADDLPKKDKLEQALWHMRQIYPFDEPAFKVLEDADWANAWRQDYTVQHIGSHVVIAPSWLEYQAQAEDVVITIDPGMAFGTGLHPSTRLCLVGLENTPLQGQSLLDVGTGSGVLAIYGAKQGAYPIVAVDTDEVAVKVARENAERNGVADRMQLATGSVIAGGYELAEDGAALWAGPFDVIAINILAEIIARLSPAVVSHLQPGGHVIAAGIIQDRESIVREAWAEAGLRVVQRLQDGDWVSLIGTK